LEMSVPSKSSARMVGFTGSSYLSFLSLHCGFAGQLSIAWANGCAARPPWLGTAPDEFTAVGLLPTLRWPNVRCG